MSVKIISIKHTKEGRYNHDFLSIYPFPDMYARTSGRIGKVDISSFNKNSIKFQVYDNDFNNFTEVYTTADIDGFNTKMNKSIDNLKELVDKELKTQNETLKTNIDKLFSDISSTLNTLPNMVKNDPEFRAELKKDIIEEIKKELKL
ncbi:MAG: hypothetical protein Wins2KO_13180 [Winogradskyella sp.]